MQIPACLNPIRNIAVIKHTPQLTVPTTAASAGIVETSQKLASMPHTTEAIEQFVTTHKEKLSTWVKNLAPRIGLATQAELVQAKQPVRNMLLLQSKNAETAIFNGSLQCVGAGVGFSLAKWGSDMINYLFHTSVSLSPELSIIARTVPISVFFNSLFRILENRRTLQVAQKNLALLK